MELETYLGLGRWRFYADSNETEFDEAMARVYGMPTPVGQGWRGPSEVAMSYVHEEDRAFAAMADAEERLEIGDCLITVSRPFRVPQPNGTVRWCRVYAGQPKGATVVEGYLVDASDLAEARARQRALEPLAQRAERMAAAETLAAPLAHDLANLITPILATLDLLGEALPEDDENRELVEISSRAAAAVLPMLRRLVGIVRESPRESSCGLGAAVIPTLDLLRRVIPADVELQADLTHPEARVALAEGELIQVLTNVVLNAAQALGGKAGAVTVTSETSAHGIELVVEDDGPGFDLAQLDQIIRGFRTTKPTGTGLGLLMVRSVLERRGGAVTARNRPEGGARVSLWLPAAASAPGPSLVAPPVAGEGRRVVLQPGDEGLSRTVAHLLTRQGFEVRLAPGILSAQYLAQREAVSLMVVVEGAEESERACRTAYAGAPPCLWVGARVQAGPRSVITPFTLDDLNDALREALSPHSAA